MCRRWHSNPDFPQRGETYAKSHGSWPGCHRKRNSTEKLMKGICVWLSGAQSPCWWVIRAGLLEAKKGRFHRLLYAMMKSLDFILNMIGCYRWILIHLFVASFIPVFSNACWTPTMCFRHTLEVTSKDLGFKLLGFESCFCYLHALWPWTSSLISHCSSFHIDKLGRIIALTWQDCCKD